MAACVSVSVCLRICASAPSVPLHHHMPLVLVIYKFCYLKGPSENNHESSLIAHIC